MTADLTPWEDIKGISRGLQGFIKVSSKRVEARSARVARATFSQEENMKTPMRSAASVYLSSMRSTAVKEAQQKGATIAKAVPTALKGGCLLYSLHTQIHQRHKA